MNYELKDSIGNYKKYGVSDKALEAAIKAEEALSGVYARIDDIVTYNELKVLDAFKSSLVQRFFWKTRSRSAMRCTYPLWK